MHPFNASLRTKQSSFDAAGTQSCAPLRILVAGDASVGKTTLSRLICVSAHECTPSSPCISRGIGTGISNTLLKRQMPFTAIHTTNLRRNLVLPDNSPACQVFVKYHKCEVKRNTHIHQHDNTVKNVLQDETSLYDSAYSPSVEPALADMYTHTHTDTHTHTHGNVLHTHTQGGSECSPRTAHVWWPVELWDVSGSRTHAPIRSLFYEEIDGILLVYDCSNYKSFRNLTRWLFELCTRDVAPSFSLFNLNSEEESSNVWSEDPEGASRAHGILSGKIPILCVGNKCDCLEDTGAPLTPPFAEFPPPIPFLDRHFGGLSLFIERIWDARVGKRQTAALQERICQVLDCAPHMLSSSENKRLDTEVLSTFIQKAFEYHLSTN